MNWTAEEAATAAKGLFFSKWEGKKIVFDSRLIEKDDIFIALPGTTYDGHQHVLDALEKGAAAAIVSHIPNNIKNKDKLLLVDDTIVALQNLAAYKRRSSKAKFIAVTGSVGKTSTKELLHLALSAHGKTFSSRGNYNNFLGVPINLASMPNDTEYAILEIGMDHANEISPLSNLVQPHIAIITSVENIHRANFNSIEEIAEAKSEIFDGISENGTVILNSLSNCYSLLEKKATLDTNINKIIALGKDSQITNYSANNKKTTATMNVLNKELIIEFSSIIGLHQIQNILLSLTCVSVLGLNPEKSLNNLKLFKLPRGRGLVTIFNIEDKQITLIDDSYNAGPVSVKAALKTMSYYDGRKVAILGDMVDMGPESINLHISLKDDIISNNIDKVICFGKEMQNLYHSLPEEKKMGSYLNLKDLAKDLPNKLLHSDVLLIKGSLYINNLYAFAKHLAEGTLDQI